MVMARQGISKKWVLSFNPCIEADKNFYCPGNKISRMHVSAIKEADVVILPPCCSEEFYRLVRTHCRWVLPNYDAYFEYPGKVGQSHLFKKMGVAHPHTMAFGSLKMFKRIYKKFSGFDYPFVFKASFGGEGRYVFLVASQREFEKCLEKAVGWEAQGEYGFLLQEFVPHGGRSLRIVVIGRSFHAYWRVQKGGNSFYTNVAKGASIEKEGEPELVNLALDCLSNFCVKTGINLAGFDFLFAENDPTPAPLFLEINYFFRKRGLGGPDNYFKLLEQGVRDWINHLPG